MIEIFHIFLNEEIRNEKHEYKLSNSLKYQSTSQKYFLFKEIIFRLRNDTNYILKKITLDYLSNNINIIFKLIDMISMFHNANPIKET